MFMSLNKIKKLFKLIIVTLGVFLCLGDGYAQPSQPADLNAFFKEIVGEWIGTFDQSTNKVKAPTKYFHMVAKQTGSNSYETTFKYYRINQKTRKSEEAGLSSIITKITDSTATSSITGKGDVLINPETLRPEQHQLSETAQMNSQGILHGKGTGSIRLGGMPLGLGRNGKVTDYTSIWTMQNDTLQIDQILKVRFKVLFFSKTFNITTKFTAKRGSDVMTLIKSTENNPKQ